MDAHRISLSWRRDGGPFERGNYRTDHTVRYDGGQTLGASSAAGYGGNPALADPEQLLLSAISSCHMLTFLAVVANRGYVVDAYEDDANATLGKNADGKTAITHANLAPRVAFSGDKQPTREDVAKFHERAHQACFVANSVRTEVSVEPRFD